MRDATGGNDPAALRDTAVSAVRAALTGDQTQAQEARNQVASYEQQYRQAADQARQQATMAANAAAKVVSRGALFGFFALALGALAAWFGGRAGAVYPTLTDLRLLGRARTSSETRPS